MQKNPQRTEQLLSRAWPFDALLIKTQSKMPPKKDWDEDSSEEDSSTGPEAPQVFLARRKFDDEEEDDSDVSNSVGES